MYILHNLMPHFSTLASCFTLLIPLAGEPDQILERKCSVVLSGECERFALPVGRRLTGLAADDDGTQFLTDDPPRQRLPHHARDVVGECRIPDE